MGRHVAVECPELDAKINEACRAIGAEIDALKVPALAGVVLGGGYGRGEEPPRPVHSQGFRQHQLIDLPEVPEGQLPRAALQQQAEEQQGRQDPPHF